MTEPTTDSLSESKEELKKESKQTFGVHLNDLRKRIFNSVIAIFIGFFACFNFSEDIFRWLNLPLKFTINLQMVKPFIYFIPREDVQNLVFLAPAEAFWVHMKIAFIAGLVIAMPVVFWQLWRFIAPGLHKNEKRFAIPFVGVTSGLFFIGTSFCFFIVLPFAMKFLLNFKTAMLTPMISVEKYIDFCLKFIIAFGVVFELPVVIVFLTRSGIVSIETLSKNRKYAVLLAFIAAALLTPTPDAFNQTLMAVPILVLFEGGLIAARIFSKRGEKDDFTAEMEDEGTPGKSDDDSSDSKS